MKNKNLIIILVIGLVVLIGGGALILSSGKKATPAPILQTPSEEVISVMEPEEIGLSLTISADNKKVSFEVTNTKGISGLDYELSYMSKGDIPRGAIGNVNIKQPGQLVKQEIPLGTCSDVCHYDQDVSNIKLILKVVKTDGTISQVEKSL
ncbi:MAG: hypothetical protein Q8P29_04395 [Candidatus Levybacteria bacterium]|nr:hypothetical protein [Candidatus Levybacteria bacterium]MDZ4227814.1 hypothetical protein [Candidatus Levybacteria bacterium]